MGASQEVMCSHTLYPDMTRAEGLTARGLPFSNGRKGTKDKRFGYWCTYVVEMLMHMATRR